MKLSLDHGNLGIKNRFCEIDSEMIALFNIASHPLTCDIDHYDSLERHGISSCKLKMDRIRNQLFDKYHQYNIFTLSNIIKNQTIQSIVDYISCIQFTSYEYQ